MSVRERGRGQSEEGKREREREREGVREIEKKTRKRGERAPDEE
jgi:hypothetical protein